MKKKSITILFFLTVMLLKNVHLYAQCELPKPPGSHNLCNPMFNTTVSNTSNTIVIDNAGKIPPAGSCSITLSYYDEEIVTCAPLINCTTASLSSTSDSTVTLSLNGCAILPDLPNTAIFYINIQTSEGLYFYHVHNYGCSYVLGKNSLSVSQKNKSLLVTARK
jgi:hypothetical protein